MTGKQFHTLIGQQTVTVEAIESQAKGDPFEQPRGNCQKGDGLFSGRIQVPGEIRTLQPSESCSAVKRDCRDNHGPFENFWDEQTKPIEAGHFAQDRITGHGYHGREEYCPPT